MSARQLCHIGALAQVTESDHVIGNLGVDFDAFTIVALVYTPAINSRRRCSSIDVASDSQYAR